MDLYDDFKNKIFNEQLNEWQTELYTKNKFLVKISSRQLSDKKLELKNKLNIFIVLYYLLYWSLLFLIKFIMIQK